MGIYTELYLCCSLKEDAPKSVIDAIEWMLAGEHNTPEPYIEHQLFQKANAQFMLRTGSYSFVSGATHFFKKSRTSSQYTLIVRCDLKNYEEEIEDFIDWLTPYIDAKDGDHLGHKRYEEDGLPTLLLHPNNWKEIHLVD